MTSKGKTSAPAVSEHGMTFEQFLTKSAGAELRFAHQQFEQWKRELRNIRARAARIVKEADAVLNDKPWPDSDELEPF